TSPSARAYHAMTYDSARGRVVLFGGYDGSYRGDTWEWDGSAWAEETPTTSPSVRYAHAMAYDSARSRVVLFGGYDASGYRGDTWEYRGECGSDLIEDLSYGLLLFRPLCTSDASGLTQDVYNSNSVGLFHGTNDRFFLSSQGKQFSPLVVD